MLTDDDWKKMAALLEAYGLEKKPSAAALRTRRYRERKASQSVTRKSHKTSQVKGQSVTKASQPSVTPTAETWAAYSAAYRVRYGVEPVRNRQVNGMLANVVERLGAEEAPRVAAFYVQSNRGLYLSAKHAVNLLSKHAEALRTEWVTGHNATDTEARQADRTAALGNVFKELKEENKYGRH